MKATKQSTILLFTIIIINGCTINSQDIQNHFINDFLSKNIYNGSRFFEINPSKDTIISIDMDLKIQIPAFTFIDTSNQIINKNIQLEVKKVRNKIDVFTNQLSTQTTQNELLETDGMIYINASFNNQKVKIAEGKKITVNLLSLKPIKNPNLYKGIKKEEMIFWEIIPNNLQNLLVLPQKKVIKRPSNSAHLGDSFTILFPLYKINQLDTTEIVEPDLLNQFQDMINDARVQFGENQIKGKATEEERMNGLQNYFFSLNELGWYNVDRVFIDTIDAEFTLQIPISLESDIDVKSVYATIMLKDAEVLIQGTFNRESKIINFGNKMPISLQGQKGILAIICYHNEELLFGLKEIILQKDIKPFGDFKKMEFARFNSDLREKLKSNF